MMEFDVIRIGNPTQSMWQPRFWVIVLLLFTTAAQCQDVTVAADVSPRFIQLNERARLDLSISGKTLIEHIGIPTFNFLPDLLAIPLQSKTTPRLIDDKVAVAMGWSYELVPQRVGEIVLSDVQFTYQNTHYFANPGKIIVGAVDTFNNPSTGGVHKVKATVTTQKPFLYEPFEYRFRYLYTTVLPTIESPTSTLPDFDDFILEEQANQKKITGQIDGYYYEDIVKLLYPQRTGKIIIQPTELKLPIKANSKTLMTKPVAINVQPLPTIGKPTYFQGAVGEYRITAQVDRKRLQVRKALTLSIHITGTGNIRTVSSPKLTSIDGFKVDLPIHSKENTPNSQIYSYVLMPLKSGILQIQSIDFAYFNPSTGTYQTTQTDPIPITVLPHPSDKIDDNSDAMSWILWLVGVGSIAIIIGIGWVMISRKRSMSNIVSTPTEMPISPSEQAFSDLQTLSSDQRDSTQTSFGDGLSRILHRYLCDLQGIVYRQLNNTEVKDVCSQLGFSKEIEMEYLDILSECAYQRFAPVSITVVEQEALVSRTEKLISRIEELD